MKTGIISLASFFLVLICLHAGTCLAGQPAKRSHLANMTSVRNKPIVVIYTLTTCPHCREAKEYFTRNGIPFANHEVDIDSDQMDELMRIYDGMGVPNEKRGVPLIIIGNSVKIQGFRKEKVEEELKKLRLK